MSIWELPSLFDSVSGSEAASGLHCILKRWWFSGAAVVRMCHGVLPGCVAAALYAIT